MSKWLLFLAVVALMATIVFTGLARRTAEYHAGFWFYQYLQADSARVECEMAQPIIFPWDTASKVL